MHRKSKKWGKRGMTTILTRNLMTALLCGFISFAIAEKSAAKEMINIGTGSRTGVYFPAGTGICTLLNAEKELPMQCEALSTGGSIYNLENLNTGVLQLGIAQADTLYRAWNGEAPFKEKTVNIRVLFSLHEEMVTMAVHRDAEIVSFKRIQGKRLNVGPEGSGNERVVSELFKACKIFPGDLGLMGRLQTSAVPQALLSRSMDGFFYVVGHPNTSLAQATNSMPLKMIPLDGQCVNAMVQNKPYFDNTTIPGGLYRGVDQDTPTFGVKAWVVSSEQVSEAAIYHVVRAVFENLDTFRQQNPAFYRLSPRKMLKRVDIPYHKGALAYYKEKGWYED